MSDYVTANANDSRGHRNENCERETSERVDTQLTHKTVLSLSSLLAPHRTCVFVMP